MLLNQNGVNFTQKTESSSYFLFFIFFYLGFLSRKLTIHNVVEDRRRPSYYSPPPLPTAQKYSIISSLASDMTTRSFN